MFECIFLIFGTAATKNRFDSIDGRHSNSTVDTSRRSAFLRRIFQAISPPYTQPPLVSIFCILDGHQKDCHHRQNIGRSAITLHRTPDHKSIGIGRSSKDPRIKLNLMTDGHSSGCSCHQAVDGRHRQHACKGCCPAWQSPKRIRQRIVEFSSLCPCIATTCLALTWFSKGIFSNND